MSVDFFESRNREHFCLETFNVAFRNVDNFSALLADSVMMMGRGNQFKMCVPVLHVDVLDDAFIPQRFDNTVYRCLIYRVAF